MKWKIFELENHKLTRLTLECNLNGKNTISTRLERKINVSTECWNRLLDFAYRKVFHRSYSWHLDRRRSLQAFQEFPSTNINLK